jgi:hypothetical protein
VSLVLATMCFSKFPTASYSAVCLWRAWVVWVVIWFLDWPTLGRGSQTSEIVKTAACTRGERVWSLLIRWRWSTSDWQALIETLYGHWFKISAIFCCLVTCVAYPSGYVSWSPSSEVVFLVLRDYEIVCPEVGRWLEYLNMLKSFDSSGHSHAPRF